MVVDLSADTHMLFHVIVLITLYKYTLVYLHDLILHAFTGHTACIHEFFLTIKKLLSIKVYTYCTYNDENKKIKFIIHNCT